MNNADLYTPLDEALKELDRRQKDPDLRRRVDEYFAAYPTFQPLVNEPRAVMGRALFTPTYELIYFNKLRKKIPLDVLFVECVKDKFVSMNASKSCYGDMHFYRDNPDDSKSIVSSQHVFDFQLYEGKPINTIKTLNGEGLTQFHRRLLNSYYPDNSMDIQDISDWYFGSYASSLDNHYSRYLGMFIVSGILFEDFIIKDEHERPFTLQKVVPAFEKLFEVFKVPPLIVHINPTVDDNRPFWFYYPESVRAFI